MRKQFAVVVLGCLLAVIPAKTFADSYDVTASVLAPLPPTLPIVTGPENNSVQQNDSVFISGTCTVVVPNLIVVLLRNDEVIGSGNCLPDGTFRILVGLVLGTNVIYSKFVTITGQSGGLGAPITLIYGSGTGGSTAEPQDTSGEGLELLFETDFVQYNDDTPTSITFIIKGGKGPYTATINWGDDTQEVVTYQTNGTKTEAHRYRQILPSSVVTVQVADATGNKDSESRALVSFEKGVYVPPAVPQPTNSTISAKIVYLVGAGSLTGVLLLSRFMSLGHPFATSVLHGKQLSRRKIK